MPKKRKARARPDLRKVVWPPLMTLLKEIEALGYNAVGQKYGVSGTSIRRWVRTYNRYGE